MLVCKDGMPQQPRSGQLTLQRLWFMDELNTERPTTQVSKSSAVQIVSCLEHSVDNFVFQKQNLLADISYVIAKNILT